MLEGIVIQHLIQRILGADMVVQQHLTNLRDGITLRDGNLHGLRACGVGQRIYDLTVVHRRVQLIGACQNRGIGLVLERQIQLEHRMIIDNALVVQLLGERGYRGVLRNRDLLDRIRLDKGKNVVCHEQRGNRQHQRNADYCDHVHHRACTACIHLAAAAAAFGLLLRLLRLPIVIEMLRRELLRHRRFRTRQRYAPRFIVVKMIIHNSPLCGSASADPVIQNDFTGKCQREHNKSGLFHQQPQVVPAGADLKVRNGTASQHFSQCVQR